MLVVHGRSVAQNPGWSATRKSSISPGFENRPPGL
jgi:hypothetical protein